MKPVSPIIIQPEPQPDSAENTPRCFTQEVKSLLLETITRR